MLGDMQNWEPNVASIIEYAGDIYPKTEVVSKLVNGSVHRTNYGEIKIRSRKLGSKLVKDGYKPGDILATLALNTHCLLYTSPSPRDATLSRMPSSA